MLSPRSRLYHRQMYIDLVRAYLQTYGSRAKLARALGVTEAYLSYILTPVSSTVTGRWDAAVAVAAPHLADELRLLKTPSERRAAALAELLCTDRERRDVLRHHMVAARARPHSSASRTDAPFDRDEVAHVVAGMGRTHAIALHDVESDRTREAYAWLWENGTPTLARIDTRRFPLDYVQVLLFLHDTASVLDRQDLALGYARTAQMLLADVRCPGTDCLLDRFRLNALLAETVSLNNLGLWRQASVVALSAATTPGHMIEPDQWQRSFLEQRLAAMAASHRFSVYGAESIADRANELVPGDPVLQAGITARLADIYLAKGTARSVRKAGRLLTNLTTLVGPDSALSPLRRVRILRALIRYCRATGDGEAEGRWRIEMVATTTAANLSHQSRLA